MNARVGKHIRGNLVAYVALFVALGGSAWAASPLVDKNTVNSRALINGQVKRADLAPNAVTSAKVANGTLDRADFTAGTLLQGPPGPPGPQGPPGSSVGGGASGPAGGALTGTYPNPRVGANAVGTEQVINDGLLGADIRESTLEQVPSALIGGLGRSGSAVSCDPESATFVTCASVTLNLPVQTRVLVMGQVSGFKETGADTGHGVCRLGTSVAGGLAGTETRFLTGGSNYRLVDIAGLFAITPPLGPGSVSFGIDCNQTPNDGAIQYERARVSAVAISPS